MLGSIEKRLCFVPPMLFISYVVFEAPVFSVIFIRSFISIEILVTSILELISFQNNLKRIIELLR